MSEIIEDPAHLRVGEADAIAKLIGVPFGVIFGLIEATMKERNKKD